MANGVNQVFLIGNLGADPEVRYTQNGGAVANLRLAVGERRKVRDRWEDHTEWVNVVAFGKTAENVGQFLSKGRQVHVQGRLQTRKYQDKAGNERKATEVVAERITFLGGGEDHGDGRSSHGHTRPSQRSVAEDPNITRGGSPDGFYDDDLPF